MNIKKISLETHIPGELVDFYKDILEMNVTLTDKGFHVFSGNTELVFNESKMEGEPFYHFAFNIPENQLEEAIKWLGDKVDLIPLDGKTVFDFKAWDAHSIYFYDPAGNIVEFIARHRLRNSSQKEFTGKSILSVSEMGMPVEKVKPFFEKLHNELKLPLFTGDLKTFTAAGDDDGLLIIVPEERKWFPDCPRAEIYPIEIIISGMVRKEVRFDEYNYIIKCITD